MPKYSIVVCAQKCHDWNNRFRNFQTIVHNRLNIDISKIFEATEENAAQILEIAKGCKIKIILNKL